MEAVPRRSGQDTSENDQKPETELQLRTVRRLLADYPPQQRGPERKISKPKQNGSKNHEIFTIDSQDNGEQHIKNSDHLEQV